MGRGNFIPSNDIRERGSDQIYVDITAQFEEDTYWNYEYLKENIEESLPKSFYAVEKWERSHSNDIHVIYENKMFQIGLADNECTVAVVVMVKEGAPAFAKANLQGVADSLFDKLHHFYYLTVRYGPWISGVYKRRLT